MTNLWLFYIARLHPLLLGALTTVASLYTSDGAAAKSPFFLFYFIFFRKLFYVLPLRLSLRKKKNIYIFPLVSHFFFVVVLLLFRCLSMYVSSSFFLNVARSASNPAGVGWLLSFSCSLLICPSCCVAVDDDDDGHDDDDEGQSFFFLLLFPKFFTLTFLTNAFSLSVHRFSR